MKITVVLPDPPPGYEAHHSFISRNCDGIFGQVGSNLEWTLGNFYASGFILKKKQPTIADWANAQPAFVALAGILFGGRIFFNGVEWRLSVGSSITSTKLPPPPPSPITNSLELSNGQWTEAP